MRGQIGYPRLSNDIRLSGFPLWGERKLRMQAQEARVSSESACFPFGRPRLHLLGLPHGIMRNGRDLKLHSPKISWFLCRFSLMGRSHHDDAPAEAGFQ